MSEYKLETSWILWNHDLKDNNWNNDSYKKIYTINNLLDYKILNEKITTNILQSSMFFLMRNNIFPTWEDKNNKNGCCASYKIPSKNIYDSWNKLVLNIISENIHNNIENYKYINGISIIPKKEFNLIKIWFSKNIKNIDSIININNDFINNKNCRIKKN